MSLKDCGVVYLAFGPKYQREAQQSIASLRRVSSVPIAVITDSEWREEPRPDIFIIREYQAGFASKPRLIRDSPFENTLYIDTDTVIVRDITPVFGLLRHYDIGVRFGGPQLSEGDGLELHTQCNSGVILFARRRVVDEVFDRGMRNMQKVSRLKRR